MTAKEIKLFDKQPKLTNSHIQDLTERGLLVAPKTPRQRHAKGDNETVVNDEITNPTAGEVVSYRPLDAALRAGKVSQDDARRLLAIETLRPNGRPRQSHISRLLVVAFAKDKTTVLERITQISKEEWQKNQK